MERVADRFSARELRGDCADKAVAGPGGIDGLDGMPGDDQRLAVHQRKHTASAQRHADDLVATGLQGTRGFDEARKVVALAKLGLGEKTKLAFIQDQDIGEVEQFALEFDRRRGIEDRGRAGRTGAAEEGGYGRQRNFELGDGDVALREHCRGDVDLIQQRIGAGNNHDGVVGVGDGNDGGPAVGIRGFAHEAEFHALGDEKLLQLLAERIPADPTDQRRRRPQFCRRDRLVGALAARKIVHGLSGDGLADPGMPVGGCHHIHIDAAGDEHAIRKCLIPKFLLASDLELLLDVFDIGQRR